jgi:hypothetical protein
VHRDRRSRHANGWVNLNITGIVWPVGGSLSRTDQSVVTSESSEPERAAGGQLVAAKCGPAFETFDQTNENVQNRGDDSETNAQSVAKNGRHQNF